MDPASGSRTAAPSASGGARAAATAARDVVKCSRASEADASATRSRPQPRNQPDATWRAAGPEHHPTVGPRRLHLGTMLSCAVIALALCATASQGVPLTEPTTAEPTTTTEPQQLGALEFTDVPKDIRRELGSAVLLPCRSAETLAECRWSWRPLPPTSLPLPNIDDSQINPDQYANTTTAPTTTTTTSRTTTSSSISTSSSSTTPSLMLPVRTFPAFGNASNDCSVRFASIKYEQTGYWSCAARRPSEDSFTSTQPAKLSILLFDAADAGEPVRFEEQLEDSVEVPAGAGARLGCSTLGPVRECQWSWRQLNQTQPSAQQEAAQPLSSEPAGDNATDCSLILPAVHAEHEGVWSCAARNSRNSPFQSSPYPVKLLISEVKFVQLSRDIQVAAGETVLLRCLINKPAFQCEWSWRASNSSNNSTLARVFAPSNDSQHDCSVRFKKIVYEEEGLWTCGVRLTPHGILHEAPSTTVTLLPSGKVKLTEQPENTGATTGSEPVLRCATNAKVERCAWAWRGLNSRPDTEPQVLHDFPSQGELGRDCSLRLPGVQLAQQGYWSCRVQQLAGAGTLGSTEAKLTVYEEEEVKFSELSRDIQISSGGSVSLRCVTVARVEQCRWSLTPEGSANTTVVVKQFAPVGPEGRDCSVKLSHARLEQEGLWTCGAQLLASHDYTDAAPARLSLIEPEPIAVTVWGMQHQMVKLACKTGFTSLEAQCFWTRFSGVRLPKPSNSTRKLKYTVTMNHTTGECKLEFIPDESDFGEWSCEFVIENEHMRSELGSASILLLNNSPDEQLSWLVGALTSTVLFLLIVGVAVIVCRSRDRRLPSFLETLPPGEAGPKIDLSYANPNFLSAGHETISSVLPNRSPHLHDRQTRLNS